jgi:cytochrome c-type biogenesis protein
VSVENITVPLALLAGFLSFISPCVLPLVPVYLGYLTGSTIVVGEGGEKAFAARFVTLAHAFSFVAGFTLVFVALGMLLGALGGVLSTVVGLAVKLCGLLLILFGLHTAGLLPIPFFFQQKRLEAGLGQSPGYLRSLFIGMAFAAGWMPCVGPLLGAVLTLAAQGQEPARAAFLLFVYSMGLGLPFLLMALLLAQSSGLLRRLNRHMRLVEIVSGVFLILVGLLLVTDTFALLNIYTSRITPAWLIELL